MSRHHIGLGVVAVCCLTLLVFLRSSPTRDTGSSVSSRTIEPASHAHSIKLPALRTDSERVRHRINRTPPPLPPPLSPPPPLPPLPLSSPLTPPSRSVHSPPPTLSEVCSSYMHRCTNGTRCIVDSAGDPLCSSFTITPPSVSAYAAAYQSPLEADIHIAVIFKTHVWNTAIRREVDRMSVSFRAGVEAWKQSKSKSTASDDSKPPEIVPALHLFVLYDITTQPPPYVGPHTRDVLGNGGVPLAAAIPAVLITYTAADFPANYATASGLKGSADPTVRYGDASVSRDRDPDTKYHADMVLTPRVALFNTLVASSFPSCTCQVPLLFRRHPVLSRYNRMQFTIENDVKYTGDWHQFFISSLLTPAASVDGLTKTRPSQPIPQKRHPMHTCMDLVQPPPIPPPKDRDWITWHDPQWPTHDWFWRRHSTLTLTQKIQDSEIRNALGMIWGYSSRLLLELDRLHRSGEYGFSEVFVPTVVHNTPSLHSHTVISSSGSGSGSGGCHHYTCCEFMSVANSYFERWSHTEPSQVPQNKLSNCLLHPVKRGPPSVYKHEIDNNLLLPPLPT